MGFHGKRMADDRLEFVREVGAKPAGSCLFKRIEIERTILGEVGAELQHQGIGCFALQCLVEDGSHIRFKNPDYQIIFVLEVVVEAFAVHRAAFADVRDGDLLESSGLHAGFQCISQRSFGQEGI